MWIFSLAYCLVCVLVQLHAAWNLRFALCQWKLYCLFLWSLQYAYWNMQMWLCFVGFFSVKEFHKVICKHNISCMVYTVCWWVIRFLEYVPVYFYNLISIMLILLCLCCLSLALCCTDFCAWVDFCLLFCHSVVYGALLLFTFLFSYSSLIMWPLLFTDLEFDVPNLMCGRPSISPVSFISTTAGFQILLHCFRWIC